MDNIVDEPRIRNSQRKNYSLRRNKVKYGMVPKKSLKEWQEEASRKMCKKNETNEVPSFEKRRNQTPICLECLDWFRL